MGQVEGETPEPVEPHHETRMETFLFLACLPCYTSLCEGHIQLNWKQINSVIYCHQQKTLRCVSGVSLRKKSQILKWHTRTRKRTLVQTAAQRPLQCGTGSENSVASSPHGKGVTSSRHSNCHCPSREAGIWVHWERSAVIAERTEMGNLSCCPAGRRADLLKADSPTGHVTSAGDTFLRELKYPHPTVSTDT